MNSQKTISSQKTIKSAVSCSGIGLHTGAPVEMRLLPAAPGTGVRFRRTDLAGQPEIPALYTHAAGFDLGTNLATEDGASVATVEHLMAALAGMEVDNVLICLDGPEVPAMDGSAQPFVEMLEQAGLIEQAAARRFIQVLKTVTVTENGHSVSLAPADELTIQFSIDFANPLVGIQDLDFRLSAEEFRAELASARTFGFLEDVAAMQARGLALGGSLDNAVVVSGDTVLNEGGLRFDDEFVRHKALDALGDLYLAGAAILGAYTGERAGHALNYRLLRALFADNQAWRVVKNRPARQIGRPRTGRQAALAR